MKWPEKTYLFNREHRFVYCPIPKVAMSSLKLWVLLVADERADPRWSYEEVSARLKECASFRRLRRREAQSMLRDPVYFKFAFVRNPWSRLVSAYLNKFLPLRRQARAVIDEIAADERREMRSGMARGFWASALARRLWGVRRGEGAGDEDDLGVEGSPEGITFRQFVEYVASRDPATLNRHWRPQHLFLGDHAFDFVGKLERLEEDFGHVRRRLGIEIGLPHRNPTAYTGGDAAAGACLADRPPENLRDLPSFPGHRSFYTPDLAALAGRVYAEDAARFGYDY